MIICLIFYTHFFDFKLFFLALKDVSFPVQGSFFKRTPPVSFDSILPVGYCKFPVQRSGNHETTTQFFFHSQFWMTFNGYAEGAQTSPLKRTKKSSG